MFLLVVVQQTCVLQNSSTQIKIWEQELEFSIRLATQQAVKHTFLVSLNLLWMKTSGGIDHIFVQSLYLCSVTNKIDSLFFLIWGSAALSEVVIIYCFVCRLMVWMHWRSKQACKFAKEHALKNGPIVLCTTVFRQYTFQLLGSLFSFIVV